MVEGPLPPKEPLRSAQYLAEAIGVHPKTIARWIQDGILDSDEDYIKGEDQVVSLFRETTVRNLKMALARAEEYEFTERERVAMQQENSGPPENRLAFVKWRIIAAQYRRLHQNVEEMDRAS